jgi:HSP20 family molecular chaperone IbpA
MASFFEKLIGDQGEEEKPKEKKAALRPQPKKPAKKTFKAKVLPETKEEQAEETKEPMADLEVEEEAQEEPIEERAETKAKPKEKRLSLEKDWPLAEGQLAIDVYQTDDEIVIESAIGGVKPKDLEITIENGMVQIKGSRQKVETVEKNNYFIQECHWGSFSRQFVLPVEVDASRSEASLKDGILVIRIPKIQREKVTKLEIRE